MNKIMNDKEINDLKNEEQSSRIKIFYYQKGIAESLRNGNMGKEISQCKIRQNKSNFIIRFFQKLFRIL